MKTYQIVLRRDSYVTLTIDAEDQDEAETKAWVKVDNGNYHVDDNHWELSTIEEVDL